jgi:hypothetical protein
MCNRFGSRPRRAGAGTGDGGRRDRGIRADRRHAKCSTRPAERLNRLALPTEVRLAGLLRGSARRRPQRLLADYARRRGCERPATVPRRDARARDRARDRRGTRSPRRFHAAAPRRGSHRPARGRRARTSADANGPRASVRLRSRPPLASTGERDMDGDRGPGQRPPRHDPRRPRARRDTLRRVRRRGRDVRAAGAGVVPVTRAASSARRSAGRARGDGVLLGELARFVHL